MGSGHSWGNGAAAPVDRESKGARWQALGHWPLVCLKGLKTLGFGGGCVFIFTQGCLTGLRAGE